MGAYGKAYALLYLIGAVLMRYLPVWSMLTRNV